MLDVERGRDRVGRVSREEGVDPSDMAVCGIDSMRPRDLPDSTAHARDNHPSAKYIARANAPPPPLPLDAALLCRKLNVHKREQDALRRSREKRELFRNGQYVPRSAAKSFADTHDDTTVTPPARRRKPKHIPDPLPMIAEPSALEEKTPKPERQPHITLDDVPMSSKNTRASRSNSVRSASVLTEEPTTAELEREEPTSARLSEETFDLEAALAAIQPQDVASERHDSKRNSSKSQKHDSMDPAATDHRALDFHSLLTPDLPELQPLAEIPSLPDLQPLSALGPKPTPPRRRSSARSEEVESADRGRARYRPGDAAKRRHETDPIPSPQQERSTSSTTHHAETHMSPSLEEVLLNTNIPELKKTPPVVQRPELPAEATPDWSRRRSAPGAELLRHTVNLHLLPRTERKARYSQSALLESGVLARIEEPQFALPLRLPVETKVCGSLQNGHLIADAVDIIHRQRKSKRRAIVLQFFRT